jgi:hypothetical protein
MENSPSMPKRAFARGELMAERAFGKSALPASITGFPGQNISDKGFGVSCVWINMVLLCPVKSNIRAGYTEFP